MYVYIIFRQNFSDKKIFRHFRKKLLPRLFITYPKAYAKETPFMDLLLNSHVQMSHEKNPPTFHYPSCLIGNLTMVYYNPFTSG